MLKIKEVENENKLSFQNDFKRLLELSKEDSLAEKSYEFLLDLFQNGYRNGSSYFTVFFWNRFTGEIKKDYSSYKNKQLDDIPHYGRDYLSWIPFFATNLSEFFNSAAISKVFGSKNTDITVELIQENKNGLIEAIKKKIKTKLARDQKEMLSASSSNNWDFFLNKAGRGELYPIDVYPEEFQYDRFWAHTELFNDGANYLSYIPPTFNVNGRYYTQRISNLVVEFKDNGDVVIKEPYTKAIDLLLRLASRWIENPKKNSVAIEEKLSIFIQSQDKNGLYKGPDKFQLLEKNLDLYISKLNDYLFRNYNEPKLFSNQFEDLIGDQFNDEEKKVAREIMLDRVLGFLKNNSSRPTLYIEILRPSLYKMFVDYSIKNNLPIVESFKDSKGLQEALKLNRTIVYSPIIVQLGSIEHFQQKEDNLIQELNSIEKLIKSNDVKTTKIVKSEIELILKSKFVELTPRFQEHLSFVLNMNTID